MRAGQPGANGRFDPTTTKAVGLSGLKGWLYRVVYRQAVEWARDNCNVGDKKLFLASDLEWNEQSGRNHQCNEPAPGDTSHDDRHAHLAMIRAVRIVAAAPIHYEPRGLVFQPAPFETVQCGRSKGSPISANDSQATLRHLTAPAGACGP